MSGYSSTNARQHPIEGPNRGASSRESQTSRSLFRSPTHKSIEPTSNERHSPIHILNDDILLNIFYLYRLVIKDKDSYEDIYLSNPRTWVHERWWYKLAQVSRRWRYLIRASPNRLDLCLLCTYGVPVADMLAHSAPLPLVIFYYHGAREMTPEDEEGALLALSNCDRVRAIAFKLPAPKLGKFITAMDDQFLILDHLFMTSPKGGEETSAILPPTFQAPNLRQIDLWYTALPMRSPLLTTTAGLVTLGLGGIPRSAYLPPSYLLTWLSLMPQLVSLMIGFRSSTPNRDVVRQALNTPIMTHVTLPNLRWFSFRGVSAYLEDLLARISAPVLSTLQLRFFNQPTYTVPHLLQFMQTSENLTFNAVNLAFDGDLVQVVASPHQNEGKRPLWLQIMCRHLNWQVASAAQIIGTLSPLLSVVEELKLSHYDYNRSSEWHDEVDRAQWRELVRPFSGVKSLCVSEELVGELSRSLHSEDGEMPLEILPNLLELQYLGGSHAEDAFTLFTKERQTAGRPVRLVSVISGS
jgi:hypothetical protein